MLTSLQAAGSGEPVKVFREHPILFSAPMIQAIRAKRKRMTRRIAGPRYAKWAVGDRIWVKETYEHRAYGAINDIELRYVADGETDYMMVFDADRKYRTDQWKRKPSIFMPRWASRITLEITAKHDELLQDITEEDAQAEGIADGGCLLCGESSWPKPCCCGDNGTPSYRDAFCSLWDSLNAKRGYGWHVNPTVTVIEFAEVIQ
jgi:hypothetical protein